MKNINCTICARLVFILAAGSKAQPGGVAICRGCYEETLRPEWDVGGKSCDEVDDLFGMMGIKSQR